MPSYGQGASSAVQRSRYNNNAKQNKVKTFSKNGTLFHQRAENISLNKICLK